MKEDYIPVEVYLQDTWYEVDEYVIEGTWLKWETPYLEGFAPPKFWRFV